MANHIRASQVRLDDTQAAHTREDPLTASSGRPSEGGVTGHQEGSRGLTSPSRHAHLRHYCTVGAIRRRSRRAERGWSGPRESLPLQPGRPPPRKGTDDNRTATALRAVAWAAAVFPSNPPGRRWRTANVPLLCGHDSVSPHTAQGDVSTPVPAGKRPPEDTRWRPSRASAPHKKSPDRQRSGQAATKEWRPGRRRATRLPTEERATQGAREREQCVGTCDRGLEEGAAHRRCVTPPLRRKLRAVSAEQGTPTAQPFFGVTDLLLATAPSPCRHVLGCQLLQPHTVVGRGEHRGGSPPRGRCEVGPEGREKLPRLPL